MILFAVRLILIGWIALGVIWVGLYLAAPDPHGVLLREGTHFLAAFPNPSPPGISLADEIIAARFPDFIPPGLHEGTLPSLRASLAVSRLHLGIGLKFLPVFLLVLSSGLLLGAILRERNRFGTGYASPALAFVAKRLLALALLYVVIWALTPLPFPYWTVHLAALSAALGGAIYVGNLPVRL